MNKYKIENIPIDLVKLNDKNPRFIKDADFKKLVKSLKECPQLFDARPLLCSDRTGELIILGGNMRYRAALELQWKDVPVIVMKGLTDAQEKEIVIKDNGDFGEWNVEILAADWAELPLDDWGADLPINWMDAGKEAVEDEFDADAAADNIVEPITKTGDVWLLGRHRVMCGDSTKKEDVGRLMGEIKADMCFTDPPYGVSYADKNAMLNAVGRGNSIQTEIVNDHKTPQEMNQLWNAIFSSLHSATTDRASYYITGPQAGELMMMMMMSIVCAGWQLKHMIIWVKNNHVLGRCDYHYKHEPILYGWKDGESHDYYGGTSQFSVWEIDKPLKSELHPTMKPVELVARAINNSTKENQYIVDFCLGSGTSVIAAEQLNRICYGMEIDPVYCDVIVKRWETLTGQKAELKRN